MIRQPVLFDLFCGAGGCSVGYSNAGFDVVGCDSEPQKRYPFDFLQMDALEALRRLLNGESLLFGDRLITLADISAIHTSPPCQVYSVTAHLSNGTHPDLVEPVRDLLVETGKPYVIENVPGAPLIGAPLLLCGSMFGLALVKHRYFENNIHLWLPPHPCLCSGLYTHSGHGQFSAFASGATAICVAGNDYDAEDGRTAMGIDWMTKKELSQAIPPAYTEYVGRFLIGEIE